MIYLMLLVPTLVMVILGTLFISSTAQVVADVTRETKREEARILAKLNEVEAQLKTYSKNVDYWRNK